MIDLFYFSGLPVAVLDVESCAQHLKPTPQLRLDRLDWRALSRGDGPRRKIFVVPLMDHRSVRLWQSRQCLNDITLQCERFARLDVGRTGFGASYCSLTPISSLRRELESDRLAPHDAAQPRAQGGWRAGRLPQQPSE